jgi:Tol biopolymer transport system component
MLACSGCTGKADSAERQGFGKIYFVSNNFEGTKRGESTGTCVYQHGEVKKLYQKYWLTEVTTDGKIMATAIVGENSKMFIKDLATDEMEKISLEHHLSRLCWFNNDNSKLIYIGYDAVNDKEVIDNIFLLDLETGEEKNLTNITEKDLTIYRVCISPDDTRIVYSIKRSSKQGSGVYFKMLNLETGEGDILPFDTSDFGWSPIEDKIVIWGIKRDKDGKVEEFGSRYFIYDVKPKTYEEIKPEGKFFREQEYTFSPDGKRIAYIRIENNGHKTLRTMNIDRTDEEVLIDWKNSVRSLSWTK